MPRHKSTSMNILVLDDYFFGRESIRTSLAKEGRKVDLVKDGTTALKMLLAGEYEVFITDLFHDGIAGIDLIKEIKRRKLPVAIVVTSGNHSLDSIRTALDEGADDYLLKPFKMKRLVGVVERFSTIKGVDNNNNTEYINDKLRYDFERNRPLPDPEKATAAPPPSPRTEDLVRELFIGLPADATDNFGEVMARVDAFREEAIRQLEKSLNAYLSGEKPATFEDKQKVAYVVNVSLGRLGLGIRHKGQICNFAVTTGGDVANGRFLLCPRGSKTPLLTRVKLADFLPFDLTDASPRPTLEQSSFDWRGRTEESRTEKSTIGKS